MLLTVEQTNELLLKNYDLRPTGSTVMPKTHVFSNKSFDYFRGHGWRQSCDFQRVDGRSNPKNQNKPQQQRNNLAMNCENDKKLTWK